MSIITDTQLKSFDFRVLLYILNKPNDWIPRKADIAKSLHAGREKINASFERLQAAGFLVIEKPHASNGRFQPAVLHFHEIPVAPEQRSRPVDGIPVDGKPVVGRAVDGRAVDGTPVHLLSTEKKELLKNEKNSNAPSETDAQDFTIWNLGVKKLVAADGINNQAARKFLGAQIKLYGKGLVAHAVTEMLAHEAVEPKSYIKAVLQNGRNSLENNNGTKHVTASDRRNEALRDNFRVVSELRSGSGSGSDQGNGR